MRNPGTQGGAEVDPAWVQGTKIHGGGKAIKPLIGRDILRVSVKQDLCYLWRNSWIIITIGLGLAGMMDTVLPLCSGCLTGDKQTPLNNNLGAIPPQVVT